MRRLQFKLSISICIPDFFCRLGIRLILIYRRHRYGYTFRKINLTQGKYAIVDVEDYESLNSVKWHAVENYNTWYAYRSERINGKNRSIQMHRKIINPPEDKIVDHVNHNGLDNRKANLRLVSHEQNVWNNRKQKRINSSQYKGVTKKSSKWEVCIRHKGKYVYLGRFDDEQAAARAYDAKAKELFGEYACLNFPKQNTERRTQ